MTAPSLPAIRELLAGVEDSGGLPWRRVTGADGTGAGVVDSSGSVIGYGTGVAVADLLAAAPSIVAQLVGVVERVEALCDLADSRGIVSGPPLEVDAIRAAITEEGQ